MQFFYDGQIRRYVGQIIRMLSGFKYQTADGKQRTVPVAYGDLTRQVANIIRENSENKIPSAPRIAVYITDMQLDRTRLADSTHISKVNIRERQPITDDQGAIIDYAPFQGNGYTVERLMPTPYRLTVKADIWSTNTDQKLQILEQILMLFNPSLELQTTDNYVDWTSISVLEVSNINFSSRNVPQGIDSDIDIATITFETPIFISPPTKVTRLGVIHDIIMNIHDGAYSFELDERVNISGFDVYVYFDKSTNQYYAELLDEQSIIQALSDDAVTAWKKTGQDFNWRILLDQYAGKFRAGVSQIFLKQANGNELVGAIALSPLDETKLVINFDQDTYNTNTLIGNSQNVLRGTVDAIVNPETYNPGVPSNGTRLLLLNSIEGSANLWNNFSADANDIVEYVDGVWEIVFDADQETVDTAVYTTNLRTGVQYQFDNGEWVRAFEGEYQKGYWRIVL
jgi:hypothetical protein